MLAAKPKIIDCPATKPAIASRIHPVEDSDGPEAGAEEQQDDMRRLKLLSPR